MSKSLRSQSKSKLSNSETRSFLTRPKRWHRSSEPDRDRSVGLKDLLTSRKCDRFTSKSNRLTLEIGCFTSEGDHLTSEVGDLSSEVGDLSSEVGHLSSKVDRLTSEVGHLSSKVEHLSSEVERCLKKNEE